MYGTRSLAFEVKSTNPICRAPSLALLNNMNKKIKKILEEIRPSLQMDGGDVTFVAFDKKTGVLKVELLGMCAHCPMSQITLKQGIEAEIKKAIPEVKEVKTV